MEFPLVTRKLATPFEVSVHVRWMLSGLLATTAGLVGAGTGVVAHAHAVQSEVPRLFCDWILTHM